MSDKQKTYFDRAIEISTSNQNCQDDNWGDWCNLCGEADAENKALKKQVSELQHYGCFVPDEANCLCLIAEENNALKEELHLAKAALGDADAALDGFGDKELVEALEEIIKITKTIPACHTTANIVNIHTRAYVALAEYKGVSND